MNDQKHPRDLVPWNIVVTAATNASDPNFQVRTDGSASIDNVHSVCYWCLDAVKLVEGAQTIYDSTFEHFPDHRDLLTHEAQVFNECLICEHDKADLLLSFRDSITVIVCCGCAVALSAADPEHLVGYAFESVAIRRVKRWKLDAVSVPRSVQRRSEIVIDTLTQGGNNTTIWMGPVNLWVSSGLKVTDFRKVKLWLDKNWQRMPDDFGPGSMVKCPPHMANDNGWTELPKLAELGRAHTKAAEPVWISADLSTEIASRAETMELTGFSQELAVDALDGNRVGLLVFDRPIVSDHFLAVIVGIQYALVPGGAWVVPLTHARGIKRVEKVVPDHALAQISGGYFLRAIDPDAETGLSPRYSLVSRLLVAFWELANEPATVATVTDSLREETRRVGRKKRPSTIKALSYRVSELRRPELPEREEPDTPEEAAERRKRGKLTRRHQVRKHIRRVWKKDKNGVRYQEPVEVESFWQGPEGSPEALPKESFRKMTR